MANNSLKVRFLGGVGEIGKNTTALEYGKDIIIIDAGLTFPTEQMPGIDLVIPDITYLNENKNKIRGLILTHGHEDHIGGLPYLLKEIDVPVYGTKLTLALAENKLREQNINGNLNCIKPRTVINLGCFKIEFINVNHSIAGSCALAITTPIGVVFHTGDFKIDLTPISGERIDLTRMGEIGKSGVLLMLADSTNVERPGYTMSEVTVNKAFDHIFSDNLTKRIIIATFSTNIHRVQHILELAKHYKRKVALSGRSMLSVVEAAAKVGEIKLPEGVLIDLEKTKKMPDKEIVIISTGTQGEPMSALTRMSTGDFNSVKVGTNDTIVLSASAIPGNERMIYTVINNLCKLGANVIYESLENIHVSGHACREELKTIHALIRPKFFIPVHGEYRHLMRHKQLAMEMGMREGNVMIPEIGVTVELTAKSMRAGAPFTAGSRLVDGLQIDGTESFVLRDRRRLAEDGLIVAVVTLNGAGEFISQPDLINRGTAISPELLGDAKKSLIDSLMAKDVKAMNTDDVRDAVRSNLKKFFIKRTKNNPMILPVVLQV